MTQSWTWAYLDIAGVPAPDAGIGSAFPSQGDAEAYLGESWQELADAGVAAVSLFCDGELVYGPMSLAGEH